MIRKFIVRQMALSYRVKIFGHTIVALRITRLYNALFFVVAVLAVNGWMHGIVAGLCASVLILLSWIGFSWWGVGYFELWPVQWWELSDFQKFIYARHYKLTPEQFTELQQIIVNHPEWEDKKK